MLSTGWKPDSTCPAYKYRRKEMQKWVRDRDENWKAGQPARCPQKSPARQVHRRQVGLSRAAARVAPSTGGQQDAAAWPAWLPGRGSKLEDVGAEHPSRGPFSGSLNLWMFALRALSQGHHMP